MSGARPATVACAGGYTFCAGSRRSAGYFEVRRCTVIHDRQLLDGLSFLTGALADCTNKLRAPLQTGGPARVRPLSFVSVDELPLEQKGNDPDGGDSEKDRNP